MRGPANADDAALVARLSGLWRVGHLAGDAAHAMNNHLQVILGNAELLDAVETLPERARRPLARLIEAGRLASAANGELLSLVRDATTPAALEADACIGDAIAVQLPALSRLSGDGTAFRVEVEPSVNERPLDALAARSVAAELIACLVLQARSSVASGTPLVLHVGAVASAPPASAGEALRVRVEVDGVTGIGEGGTESDARDDGARTPLAELMAALADRAGARLHVDGESAGRVRHVALFPLRATASRPTT